MTTTTETPDRFLLRAKECVVQTLTAPTLGITNTEQLYIVWFSKTLQNWKALISSDDVSGVYWEVTHNGDKRETYVDTYSKVLNSVFTDG